MSDRTGEHNRKVFNWAKQTPMIVTAALVFLVAPTMTFVGQALWSHTKDSIIEDGHLVTDKVLGQRLTVQKQEIYQKITHESEITKTAILSAINKIKPGATASMAPTYMKGQRSQPHSGE